MNDKLKQAIEEVAERRYGLRDTKTNVIQRNCFRAGVDYTLFKGSNFLRHADPEIMKQAGWVKSEDIMKLFEEYQTHEGCGCCGDYEQSKLVENAMRVLTNLPKQ